MSSGTEGEAGTATGRVLDAKARRRVFEQIEVWRNELINLARSNRLLYFRHTRSSTLEIVREPDRTAEVVDRLLGSGSWRFFFPADADESDGSETQELFEHEFAKVPTADELITSKNDARALGNALRLLDRRATQEFMDKGIWILYLAAGMLHWKDPDTEETAESPLVLIPVVLHRENPREPYELRRADEDMVINPALAVKLADFGIELPTFEEEDLNLDELLEEVDRAVASRQEWQVKRRLVISTFSFHKEVMFRDLLKNEEEVAEHALVQALSIGVEEGGSLDFDPIAEEDLDEKAPPEDVITILDADATQRQCIAAADSGSSFVMDGPPGTGKSQTIANLIAELLAKGRTVLFVSEKAAALEVVQKRLRAAGLGDYTLELHSHKATRKEVAHQLGASLELHPTVPAPMSRTALSKLLRRRQELSERAAAMNEIRLPLGRTLHQAIGRIAQLQQLPQAPPPPMIDETLSAEQLSRILVVAETIARAWGPVERGSDFLWRDLKDVRLDASRQQRADEQVEQARRQLMRLKEIARDTAEELLMPWPSDFMSAELLVRVLKQLEARREIPQRWLTDEMFEPIEARLAELETLSGTYNEIVTALVDAVGERWRDLDPASNDHLSKAHEALRKLTPPYEPPEELPATELRVLEEFLAKSVAATSSFRQDAELIATAFALPTSGMTIARAAELADLALLAADPARPEPAWVNPAMVDAVAQAAQTLAPLCRAFAERREELGRVFADEVLALDLESLCDRFQNVHTGFGKFKSAYRTDKAAVAAVTRSGKATKEAIALLPQALEWRRLSGELEHAEHQHAGLLGEHYYRGTESDFDAITRALTNLRRALSIAGRHLNAEAMRHQLARGETPNADLHLAGQRLKETLLPWIEHAKQVLGEYADPVCNAEFEVATEWCRNASTPIGQIADEARRMADLSGRALVLGQVVRAADARAVADGIERSAAAAFDSDRALLGERYEGLASGWESLNSAIAWAATLRELLGGPVAEGTAKRLQEVSLNWAELDKALDAWYQQRDEIAATFTQARCDEIRKDLETTFADADDLLRAFAQTIGDIDEWVEHQRSRGELDELNVKMVIDFCEESRVPAEEVEPIVERACLERWADAVIDKDMTRLQQLRAEQLDPIIEEFRKLDLELIDHAAGRVIEKCNEIRPRTTVGAAGVIKRESQKQRKHMPVRKLLEDAGEVAQALKPCFMMSPLTVSQFLPPSLKFDAVVFDEASQVRPSDAINCVYRGHQLIVAGDDKQLPPTSFFEAVAMDADDSWEEEQFDEFDSILQLCKGSGGLRGLPLKWHYRSQHEDLITYSNQSFYDGKLITFPGAASEAEDLGVKFFHVPDGVYRRGTTRDNPREAHVVVDRVVHWARMSQKHPEEEVTVGVVAFSEAQATAIETELDGRRQSAPELDGFFSEDRLDGFFVKNLENVQGDERDVMIFSVGYGPDENGKLTMNFGPLNRAGGKRRLNVAITRARRRVEVVSSITAADFKGDIGEGARHLQRYLDYADRGPVALALEIGESGLDAESPFEEEVIRTIRSWGYTVEPQVGTAKYRVDLGVRDPATPGRFVLGVECDGSMYHSSKVARDRDRLRQEVLERLGWRIYRIWGTAWYRNRREQEERLKAAIELAIKGGGSFQPSKRLRVDPAPRSEAADFEPVSLNDAPKWTVPYVIASPTSPRNRRLEMHQPEAQAEFRRMISEVVAEEGPVRDEIVLRRVREAWGVGRAGHRIRTAFDTAVAALARRGDITRIDQTYLASGPDQLRAVRVPGDNLEARRDIEEVPSGELQLAVEHLLRDARRVSRDELTREVARLFGWSRRGSDIAAALERAVDALIQKGSIDRDGEWLKAV